MKRTRVRAGLYELETARGVYIVWRAGRVWYWAPGPGPWPVYGVRTLADALARVKRETETLL